MIYLWACLGVWLLLNLLYWVWVQLVAHFEETTESPPFVTGEGDVGIVLVHGFADCGITWHRVADVLVVRGYRVSVVNYTFDQDESAWLEAVEAAYGALKADCRRVWLVGHSLGGALTFLTHQKYRALGESVGLFVWAPYFQSQTERLIPIGYLVGLFRGLIWSTQWMPSVFRSLRRCKGEPRGHYHVTHLISACSYLAAGRISLRARQAATQCDGGAGIGVILPHNDRVVVSQVTRTCLPRATYFEAIDSHSSHALTCAADWRSSCEQMIAFIERH